MCVRRLKTDLEGFVAILSSIFAVPADQQLIADATVNRGVALAREPDDLHSWVAMHAAVTYQDTLVRKAPDPSLQGWRRPGVRRVQPVRPKRRWAAK